MNRAGALLVAAWCALAITACAMRAPGSKAPVAPQPPSPPPVATGIPPDPHGQITQLAAQIDAQRGQLGLPLEAPTCLPSSCQVTRMDAAPSAVTCQSGTSATCRDTCTLSDSICLDAKKICDLAGTMPGDTWAAGKCATAKQTCDDAHARCCACH